MKNKDIRNFVIIAHIDHGKSTLADRFLELTGTVDARKMQAQYLDALDLERERGITITMAPVRMEHNGVMLNLIDTPGHSDFSYEVSRALKAVEGAILLVDATQGIQAQTLANLESARNAGLTIIGALNKVDMEPSGVDELASELASELNTTADKIHRISAKTGEGVLELLNSVIEDIPGPEMDDKKKALVFSSLYDDHKGVIAFVRDFGGSFKRDEQTKLQGTNKNFKIKEVGYFAPEFTVSDKLDAGEIGYIATGLKDPDAIRIGDTIGDEALPGFQVPNPVIFVSLYPVGADGYDDLKVGLNKLKLHDSSLTFSPDMSPVLGRGFKCGFLGRLHFEIVMQRLDREFNVEVLNSFPSVSYKVQMIGGKEIIVQNPKDFPAFYEKVLEPYVKLSILMPPEYLGSILELGSIFRFSKTETETIGNKLRITAEMPLADLILDFDDRLKSVSQGYASFSYEFSDYKEAIVKKLDILLAGDVISGLSRIIPAKDVEREGRKMVEKLKELLPKQQFPQAVQAVVGGDIIARETIPAMRKNVTGALYGGDRTRKDKLLKKQKKGKKKLEARGKVNVPVHVFRELLKR